MSDHIPDEWVEAAARALYGNGWDQADHPMRQYHRSAAHDVLSAVAPLIVAQAFRDVADDIDLYGTTSTVFEAEQEAERQLRDRADRIEREAASDHHD